MRKLKFVVLAVVLSGCSYQKSVGGLLAPDGSADLAAQRLAINTLVGTWNGTSTPTRFHQTGAPGKLTVVFDAERGVETDATVTWISGLTGRTYRGVVKGTLASLAFTVSYEPSCGYKASASIPESDPTHMTGAYSGVGTGCAEDAGTFDLRKAK